MPSPRALRSELGQASVELVAVAPFVVLAALVAWQIALVGQTAWLCANAARVAARAQAVGRDAGAAARSALPGTLERGLKVSRAAGGAVRVQVRIPLLVRRWQTPLTVGASAGLPTGAGPRASTARPGAGG
jgi:pilus assembly protein CpaE